MQPMGKLFAAEALEGKFSSEGLVAMAGDDGIEMAMAKSLAENMDESADRTWEEAARCEKPKVWTVRRRVPPRRRVIESGIRGVAGSFIPIRELLAELR